MSNPVGHPACPIVEAWALRYKLTVIQRKRLLTNRLCWQLCQCRSEEARRIILGVQP